MYYTDFHPSSFPDVCIGVNDRVSDEAQFVIDTFRTAGYSVKVNEPFSGALTPVKYSHDNRVVSIMIELNRRIYENALFDAVQNLCMKIYCYLCSEAGE
jgi:N-formylglutamate amidohydrolase